MPVYFRRKQVAIPSGYGRRSFDSDVTFDSNVIRAEVAINGFKLDFVSGDRHINIVEIDTDIRSFIGKTVKFRVDCD